MINNIFIGFDRDGTLETPHHPLPSRLIKQFEQLNKQGIKLFLASGKPYSLLNNISLQIKLNAWMICAENGGHIVIPSEKIDCIHALHDDLISFKKEVANFELPPHREEPKHSIWSKQFGEGVLEAEAHIKKFIEKNNWNLKVYSYPDGNGGLDVVPPGIDKSNLLHYIPHDATIYYIGDDFNDVGLLSHERVIPCTVANAQKAIKETVLNKNGHIATKPAGEGVAEILSHLFNI